MNPLRWASWSMFGLSGLDDEGRELHLIVEEQHATDQESVCGASPPPGCLWVLVEGPSSKAPCINCAREKGKVLMRRHRYRKLQLVSGKD